MMTQSESHYVASTADMSPSRGSPNSRYSVPELEARKNFQNYMTDLVNKKDAGKKDGNYEAMERRAHKAIEGAIRYKQRFYDVNTKPKRRI